MTPKLRAKIEAYRDGEMPCTYAGYLRMADRAMEPRHRSDLDLVGDVWQLSNAVRDLVKEGQRLTALNQHLHQLNGKMLGMIERRDEQINRLTRGNDVSEPPYER